MTAAVGSLIDPAKPDMILLVRHDHDWYEVGAERNPDGTWSSVWACDLCPDIGLGGPVGPIPPGYCDQCRWVQRTWPRRTCEECGRRFGADHP